MTNVGSDLGFVCPRCGIPMVDGWEVLAEGEVHRLTCQFCRTQFDGLIVECEACGSDDFIASLSEIDSVTIACSACGHRNRPRGADNDEESCL